MRTGRRAMTTCFRFLVCIGVIAVVAAACTQEATQDFSQVQACQAGLDSVEAGNIVRAVNIWGEQAEDASARMRLLAVLSCLEESGLAETDAAAATWILNAAQQDVVEAQVFAGLLYANGLGLRQDYGAAIDWLERAERNGSETAAFLRGGLEGEVTR
jgi:TPR repeat protein